MFGIEITLSELQRMKKKHKEKEDFQKKRVVEIEQEKRYSQLKQNKKLKLHTASNQSVVPYQEPPKHINFFEDIEKALTLTKTNPEVEEEKRVEERKNMSMLGAGSIETSDVKPWYYDLNTTQPTDPKDKEKERKRNKRLQNEDPLMVMNKYLVEKKQTEPIEKPKKKIIPKKKTDKISQLRQERLEREKIEREKVAKLLGINQPVIKEDQPGYSSGSGYSQYSRGIIRDRNSVNKKENRGEKRK